MKRWSRLLAFATMFSGMLLTTNVLSAQTKTDTTEKTDKKTSTKTKKATDSTAPTNSTGVTDADIARAQSSGMVWVNTDSKVYHKSGRYFGKTKQGKFMTEADAKKAGYREAKDEVGTKKK